MALSSWLGALLVIAAAPSAEGRALRSVSRDAANPVRKVVTLLQAMQQKVTEEGEKEHQLYEKFMCYCKSSGGDLDGSIGSSGAKISSLGSSIEEAVASKAQTDEDLKQAQTDRSACIQNMKEATGIRQKEAAVFAKTESDLTTNIRAIKKAVAALEAGVAGELASGFLQTGAARILQQLVASTQYVNDDDRQVLSAFLSQSQGADYAPQSGQIVGILKTLDDEMTSSLADATTAENDAIASYKALMAAKLKEKAALTEGIETKLRRSGDLGISIAEMKNELTDTEEALAADSKFKAQLEKGCKTKTAEWEERSKTRSEELAALAETITLLNDDDALELFKKTLPSASSSLLQVEAKESALRSRAVAELRKVVEQANRQDLPQLDIAMLALHGKKIGFAKVIKMIDNMVATLKQEQLDDDHKKEYCSVQLDSADDKKKSLEHELSDVRGAMAAAEEAIASLTAEIEALKAGIQALDASVAEATENRKSEHQEFTDFMASNSAAKEVLKLAKNRLAQFYTPKLYKAPAKRELTQGERVAVSFGGTAPPTAAPGGIAGTGITALVQISAHAREAPAPPPKTWTEFKKLSGDHGGVVALMNLLLNDLSVQMTEAETVEKDAQADYEALMRDSAEKRTADSKSLSGKQSAKAETEGALESHTEDEATASRGLRGTKAYVASLHVECDWLLKYATMRADARTSEIEALGNAKAVLSGADYSL